VLDSKRLLRNGSKVPSIADVAPRSSRANTRRVGVVNGYLPGEIPIALAVVLIETDRIRLRVRRVGDDGPFLDLSIERIHDDFQSSALFRSVLFRIQGPNTDLVKTLRPLLFISVLPSITVTPLSMSVQSPLLS